jgi:broad specificity phosphatase PhoE
VSSLTLVRHAQASFFADEYDQLSALGQEQARLLGAWWAARQWSPDEVYVGPRQRQRQTAEEVASTVRQAGLSFPDLVTVRELDEYDLEGLLRRLAPALATKDKDFAGLHERQRHGASDLEQARNFQRMFEPLLLHWQAAGTPLDELESWAAFQVRVQRCLHSITKGQGHGRRVVAFTSGGFISAAVQQVLGAPERTALEINWRIRNTALTEFVFTSERITLDVFNSTAHLASPELVTYR